MGSESAVRSELLQGSLVAAGGPWPLSLWARLCDLRPRFLVKDRVGPGCRAVARNGRVLLASDRPLEAAIGQLARVRLQTWHRAILPGDVAQPYGILLCVRGIARGGLPTVYETSIQQIPVPPTALGIDLGGGRVLVFRLAYGMFRQSPILSLPFQQRSCSRSC